MPTKQNAKRAKQKRGAVSKDNATLVSLWIPREALELMDSVVNSQDTDRSKFIRRAIQEALHAS